MSKNGVIGAIMVCLLLGLIGASILGWIYISRDRAAVATYRLELPEGVRVEGVLGKEVELLKSSAILQPVIQDLDLRTRWKLGSDEEALLRLRSKLTVKPASEAGYVKVIYKDRSQKRALEILDAINREFGRARYQAAQEGKMSPVAPIERLDVPAGW